MTGFPTHGWTIFFKNPFFLLPLFIFPSAPIITVLPPLKLTTLWAHLSLSFKASPRVTLLLLSFSISLFNLSSILFTPTMTFRAYADDTSIIGHFSSDLLLLLNNILPIYQ